MKISKTVGSVHIDIGTSRIDENVREAQKLLNMQIVADCDPLIPFQQGALRSMVRYPQGVYGNEIEYYAPHAHYIYTGEVYGPNIPIKDAEGNLTGFFSPPQKYPTGRKLQYHAPGTGAEWFEKAKAKHLHEWRDLVGRTVGKD